MKYLNGTDDQFGSFQPIRFLGNPHLQTLLGNVVLTGPDFPYATSPRRIVLEDGDRIVVHDSVPSSWIPGEPIAVLIHGLSGSHLSPPVQRLALLLWSQGCRIVRVDLRGCGAGLPLARRPYHGGCSDDLRAILREVHQWSPQSKLLVVGFSLGGNIALKLAGEVEAFPVPGLGRVAAIGPPIDFIRSVELLEHRRNRVYELHYVSKLVAQERRRMHLFPDLPRVSFPRRLTLRMFDEMYTAPKHGFRDATDYYLRAASLPVVSRINVPSFVLTARDDPFVAAEAFREATWPSCVEVIVTDQGGHLGYLDRESNGGIRWSERRVAKWILAP